MTQSVHYQKQGDLSNPILATLTGRTLVAQDLTAGTVTFSMRLKGTTTAKISKAACTITDAVNGKATYQWGGTDTDTPGTYEGEFAVSYSGGPELTFPSDSYLLVVISSEVA